MNWYRTIEVGGPGIILAVDFLNPSYKPLHCRLLGEPNTTVIVEHMLGPYHAALALAFGLMLPPSDWAINFEVSLGQGHFEVPAGKALAVEIFNPPPTTKTLVLLTGGIIVDSEVPYASRS